MKSLFAVMTLAAAVALPQAPAHAIGAFDTGNQMLAKCDAPKGSLERGYCMGSAAAVTDMMESIGINCNFAKTTVGQITDVVVQYLRNHPEDRHYTFVSLAQTALKEGFCTSATSSNSYSAPSGGTVGVDY